MTTKAAFIDALRLVIDGFSGTWWGRGQPDEIGLMHGAAWKVDRKNTTIPWQIPNAQGTTVS
jgi:hypothetical protein